MDGELQRLVDEAVKNGVLAEDGRGWPHLTLEDVFRVHRRPGKVYPPPPARRPPPGRRLTMEEIQQLALAEIRQVVEAGKG